jgi:hypothetical protein
MPINRFLQAVILSAAACGALMFWYHIDTGRPIPVALTLLALPCGIAFAPLVVVHLPLFRAFYRRDRWPDDPAVARTNRLNLTGSFPMAGLIAGGAFALASLVLGATDVGLPSFCCAIACGVTFFFMDQYGFR